jgi:hypothetical protein
MVYSYMYVSSTGMTSSSTGITVLYSPILPALWQHALVALVAQVAVVALVAQVALVALVAQVALVALVARVAVVALVAPQVR